MLTLEIQDSPVYLGCTTEDFNTDKFINYKVFTCMNCSLICTDGDQFETSYNSVHSEALGPTWERHHLSFSKFIKEHTEFNNWGHTLEIGTSTSPIARSLTDFTKSITYIDPITNPPFSLKDNEEYLSGFFPAVMPKTAPNVLIASHVLEHIPNTHSFIKSVFDVLPTDGEFFFSIPDFEFWLKSSYYNALSAEHIVYPFRNNLENLCSTLDLSLTTERYQNHSLFGKITANRPQSSDILNWAPSLNIQLLDTWSNQFLFDSVTLEANSTRYDSIFICGASHLSQYFILLSRGKIGVTAVLDNSSMKQGKRLYGTDVYVQSFESIIKHASPLIIIPPSPYQGEMYSQILAIHPAATPLLLGEKNASVMQ